MAEDTDGYCIVDDLKSAVPDKSLAEFTSEVGDVPDFVVTTKVIYDASREIDGFLAGRYKTPVTDTDTRTILRPRCIAICRFKLFARRDLEAKDDPVRVEYDTAISWLKLVAKGDVVLPPGASLQEPPDISDNIVGAYGSEDLIFTGGAF